MLGSVGSMEEGRGTPSTGPAISPASTSSSSGSLGQFNARNIYGGEESMPRAATRSAPPVEVESPRGLKWDGGYVDTDQFFNDTFATPQYIGTIDDDDIRVRGTLAIDDDDFDDFVDYYAILLTPARPSPPASKASRC